MQKFKRALALLTAIVMALALTPAVSFAAPVSGPLQAALDALEIPNADDIRGSVSLPKTGENGAEISWASSNEAVISTKEIENEGYFPTPAGVVTRGESDEKVSLTATVSLDGETARKTFDLTVKAAPEKEASLAEVGSSDEGAYLFFYFTNNGKNEQQIFLASSKNGLSWHTLNNGQPILTSSKGDMAVRDPYIIRSHEGDKFYLIATDLDASGNQWTDYQLNGSKDIVVWETENLTDWSEQRNVRVAVDYMGCTWAPEATYDPVTDEYVVYWSSKIQDANSPRNQIQTVFYATTRDFVTFSEPKPFIEGTFGMTGVVPEGKSADDPIPVIDTTIIQGDDGKFYRATKHEGESKVFLEVSDHLMNGYGLVEGSNVYTNEEFHGVEGPELYRLEDGRYCLLLDRFGKGGYMPIVTNDLSSGVFEKISGFYSFPTARHGSVLRISDEEYDRVMAEYGDIAPEIAPDEAGSEPFISYDFESSVLENNTVEDASGENDATLFGNAKIVTDKQKGSVLSLDGTSGTYMELPKGSLDGRNELTVSMDVRNNTEGNFFTFALGQNDNTYLFTKLTNDSAKAALTVNGYLAEEYAEKWEGSYKDLWTNITVTVSKADRAIVLYINGKELARWDNLVNYISDLGSDTLSYIGKSFFGTDNYANMRVDNVEIYNRTLSADEISEKYTPSPEDRQRYSVNINAAEKGAGITAGTVGLFFEDINYAGDGGLYSEAVNNRSFEAYDARDKVDNPTPIPDYGWTTVGSATADYSSNGEPLNANNKTYLTLTATAAGDGIENNCYAGDGKDNRPLGKGLNAALNARYTASLYARGNYGGAIKMQVVNADGSLLGETEFTGVSGDKFTKMSGVITIGASSDDARVRVVLDESGTIDIDMISLMPQETFNGRDNGLRADLVERLAEIHPGFLRFPGGCIIEGYNLNNRYQWKHTVGPVEQRTQNWSRWQTHNETHEGNGMFGYCQTYGLGFYEYLLLCEDIGAAAVPVVNVGLACQYQSGKNDQPIVEGYNVSSKEDLYSVYIQDALDLIQFANDEPDENWASYDYSAVDSTNPATFGNNWANLRALMGHPASFNLGYIGIGNEQWDTSDYSDDKVDESGWANNGNNFFRRYEAFEQAIHRIDESIKLISTSGPDSDGDAFDKAWYWLKGHSANDAKKSFTYAVDEHYYRLPDWFYNNVNRYDAYDRDRYAVFAGEYASRWWATPVRGNTWEAALSEAAYMTGLERNSDVVKMASYAPLFAREGAHQWSPDMIWFNNAESYGSPDYYIQQLFSRNSGSRNLKTKVVDKFDEREYSGTVGVGTWLASSTYKDFSLTDGEGSPIDIKWHKNDPAPEKYSYTVADYSSQENDTNKATNVNDGNLETRWAAQGTDQWLLLDLGEAKTVGKIRVAASLSEGREYYYALQLSEEKDGEYTTVFDGTNGMNNANFADRLAGNTKARYIKLLAKGNSYHDWNSISEIEIYGECRQSEDMLESVGEWTVNDDGTVTQANKDLSGNIYMFADVEVPDGDFTYSLTATKNDGAEGFLIPVIVKNKNNLIHLNVGGWGNTKTSFEVRTNGENSGAVGLTSPTVLETGKEYRIEIKFHEGMLSAYLDDALVAQYVVKTDLGPVYANAVEDDGSGDLIVKLVNSSANELEVPLNISGADGLNGKATQYLMTGGLLDKNSFDSPENLVPERSEISVNAGGAYTLPAYSVAVLRLHTGGTAAVSEIEPTSLSVYVDTPLTLPDSVNVTLADGTEEERSVKWRIPGNGAFANPGAFKVYGTVEGTELDAVAIVTVLAPVTEDKVITVNGDILSGESSTVVFAPALLDGFVFGKTYTGVIAVYNGDKLEKVITVSSALPRFEQRFSLTEAEGRTVKLMLWTQDEIAPVTESLTVSAEQADTE